MNEPDGISDKQAAQIDQRLGQGFAFLRDVVDDPRLLIVVPDGSTLFFRDVEIPGHQIRLVAYRIPDADNRWAARMTGSTKAGDVEPGHALMVPASVECDESAEAALDAFEELILTIVRIAHEPAHRTA